MSSIKPSQKVVTSTPVTELWSDKGVVPGQRGSHLTQDDMKRLLRQGPVQFVIADVGHPFEWIPPEVCFGFWKNELQAHLFDGDAFHFENYPGEYCYVALRWNNSSPIPIVVLEKHH